MSKARIDPSKANPIPSSARANRPSNNHASQQSDAMTELQSKLDASPATQRLQHLQLVANQSIQRAPNSNFKAKYANSSFQSGVKKQEEIYLIYTKGGQELVDYVGKSVNAQKRFKQHQADKNLSGKFAVSKITSGNWTPFETATYEQFYIGAAGGKGVLMNKINALDETKWNWFKTPTGHAHNKDQADNLSSSDFQ